MSGCECKPVRAQPSIDEVNMLDLFYVAVLILFFALMWGFTKAAERL
jgi:hypothetical protein